MTEDWCTSADGTRIACYDLGGSGPDLLLVHATGFCATVLAPLAEVLAASFKCHAIDLRFHGASARSPGDYDWHRFGEDVLAAVDHLGLERPMGFGHSCGGASLLLAELARPGTFAGLFCFEPVVLPLDEPLPPDDDNPLAIGARRRRETFPSVEDAFVNFSSKPPFEGLDPDALRGYVEGGFELIPDEEGGDGSSVRLRCRREDEAAVYAHAPTHDVFARLTEIACPVTLACGETTDAFGTALLRRMADRLSRSAVVELAGMGHFGPLEVPASVAASVEVALGAARSPLEASQALQASQGLPATHASQGSPGNADGSASSTTT